MNKLNKENIISFIKKYKLYLIIFLVVVIALIVGIIISFKFNKEKISIAKEPKIVANTKEGIIKEEIYENLTFNNISLITEDGYTTFTTDVTNTSAENSTISDVDIVLQDKDGNEVITLRGNIGEPLKPNETRTITSVTKGELKDVTTKIIAKYENTAQN